MVNPVTLETLFKGKQEAMKDSLVQNPIVHPGENGNYTEEQWFTLFKDHLPKRYDVKKAFIIDCNNNISEQLDIVIFDNYFSPFLFHCQNNVFIPAESVYAVFEVKPELNRQNFKYAMKKISSARNLERTSASILNAGVKTPGRIPHTILGGLLTTRNSWQNCLIKQNISNNDPGLLNIGCCAEDCCWKFHNGKYIWCNNKEHYLLSFFMELLNQLQQMGTVPAMDIPRYFNGFSE